MNEPAADIDTYLAGVAPDSRAALESLRRTIRTLVPDAVESISYGMPTFKYAGRPLVYFAAAKHHCALYGTSEGTIRFKPDDPPGHSRIDALLAERVAVIDAAAAARKRHASREP